eukprot:jgi/Botrbrau1/17558/Bobra.0166s0006.1
MCAPAVSRCADLAMVGHVEQAVDTMSHFLVRPRAAHEADMRTYKLYTMRY